KVAKRRGVAEQLDEDLPWQQQAEAVGTGHVGGAGRALAEQRGNGEALAGADFEGSVLAAAGVAALALHAALLDDVEILNRTVVRMQDRFALGVEAQLTVFHQAQQMALLHV